MGGSDPSAMIGFGTGILFRASTAATGTELFFSDGTPGGTTLVPGAQTIWTASYIVTQADIDNLQ